MTVIIANSIPDAVRGKLKLWFIQPKPNVFVSGIKNSVANNVVDFLKQHCSGNSGMIIFQSMQKPPFYLIRTVGSPLKNIQLISGMQLLCNAYQEEHPHACGEDIRL